MQLEVDTVDFSLHKSSTGRSLLPLLLALFFSLCLGNNWAEEQATLENVKGEVTIIRSLKKIEGIQSGYVCSPKDIVVTAAGASAVVKLPEGSEVFVGGETRLKLTNYLKNDAQDGKRNTTINLFSGASEFQVNPKRQADDIFVVKTPVAVAGVRGTRFIVQHSENRRQRNFSSSITVVSGKVAVGAANPGPGAPAQPVVLQSMQKSEVQQGGGPSAPATVTTKQITQARQSLGLEVEAAGGGDSSGEAPGGDGGSAGGQDAGNGGGDTNTGDPDPEPTGGADLQEQIQEQIQDTTSQLQEQLKETTTEKVVEEQQRKIALPPSAPAHP